MKILVISDAWHPQVNGVVRTYEHLQKELEEKGHSFHVIGPADFKNKIPTPGYKEIELVLFPYKTLKEKIDAVESDTIHIATEGPLGWAARKYCLRYNIPFTTSYHSQFPTYLAMRINKFIPKSFNFFHKIGVNIIKKFHNRSNGIFVTTNSMTEELKNWGVTAPIFPLTRGVQQDIFTLGKATEFKELTRPVALYVGRLAIEKNLEEFLSMPWEGAKIIVGHGPEEENFRKTYPDCHFLGKKTGEDLANCYRSADVFVFPSYTDTFGMVLIEALSCGLPVAGHPVIGPIDVITDPTLGALNDNLADAAQKALQHGTAEERHNHVNSHYTWEKAGQQFIETCQKIDQK